MPPAKAPEASPWQPVYFVVGLLFVLAALLWAKGGLHNINTQGFFIQPPADVMSNSTTTETWVAPTYVPDQNKNY